MENIFNLEQIYSQIAETIQTIQTIQTRQISPSFVPILAPFIFFMHTKQDPTKTNSTNFNKTNIGSNDLLQTSSSSLYENLDNDLNVKDYIGNESSNVTVYNYNIHNTDNVYDSFVQSVYRLPAGTVGISYNPQLRHFDDYYALPNETLHIAPIVFGTGDYINKQGIVAIVSSAIPSLKMIIIFLNNEYNHIAPV